MAKTGKRPARAWLILAASLAAIAIALAALKINGERKSEATDPRALAGEFARTGDYLPAAETLRAAWRAQPSESLRLEAARAYLVAGDNYSAIELLKDHSTESSLEFSRRHLYAEALLRARRYDAAAREAHLLGASSGGDARARLLSARINYGLGDFRKAAEELGASIRIGGDALAEAWLFRARIALNDNDLEAARAAMARAARAKAPSAPLRALEIEALARGGGYDAARAALNDLANAADDYGRVLARKLAVFLDASEGRYDEASRRLRDVAPLIEADPYGDIFVARIAAFVGDAAQSQAAIEAALEASPDNPAILEAGVDKLIDDGRIEDARVAASRLVELDAARGARAAMRAARVGKDFDLLARLALSAPPGEPPSSVDAMLFGAKSDAAGKSADARRADRGLQDAVQTAIEADNDHARDAALKLAGAGADAASLLVAGEILLAANADDAARSVFERAQETSAAALVGLVRIDVRGGDLVGAERRLGSEGRAGLDILRARAIAGQGRIEDAASILSGATLEVSGRPDDGALAGEIYAQAGRADLLSSLASAMRRAFPGAPQTARVLLLAGLSTEAMSAARGALIAAPSDSKLARLYVDLARETDRISEGKAFIRELIEQSGENDALARAVRALDGASNAFEEDGEPPALPEVRNQYLRSPHSANAALGYARALERRGEAESAIRLRREACFWSSSPACAENK